MRLVSLHYDDDWDGESTFRIFAALLHRTLGDFTDQLLFAASVSEMFPNARLDVYYRPDRPYKADVLSLAPQISSSWPSNHQMPVDLFDTAGMKPVLGPEEWHASRCGEPDLLLTPSMCGRGKLGYFDPIARFQVPQSEKWEDLLRKSVGESSYCILHYREHGYEFSKKGVIRNVTTDDVEPIIDMLIERGIGVVRIGHSQMAPVRMRDGFVDLSAAPFMLQVCAISRSRFFMEVSPSGPYAIANGFGVPMLRCNSLILSGPATTESIVLVRSVLDPNGRDVTRDALKQAPDLHHFLEANPDHALQNNSLEQIEAAMSALIDATSKVAGWRASPVQKTKRPVEAQFRWPIPNMAKHRVVI